MKSKNRPVFTHVERIVDRRSAVPTSERNQHGVAARKDVSVDVDVSTGVRIKNDFRAQHNVPVVVTKWSTSKPYAVLTSDNRVTFSLSFIVSLFIVHAWIRNNKNAFLLYWGFSRNVSEGVLDISCSYNESAGRVRWKIEQVHEWALTGIQCVISACKVLNKILHVI